jgi:dynein regulatry complex protein 1
VPQNGLIISRSPARGRPHDAAPPRVVVVVVAMAAAEERDIDELELLTKLNSTNPADRIEARRQVRARRRVVVESHPIPSNSVAPSSSRRASADAPPPPIPSPRPSIRQRIAARIRAQREEELGVSSKKKDAPAPELTETQKEILASKRRVGAVVARGLDAVTSVRVEDDGRERSRRVAEDERRSELRGKLVDEAERSAALERDVVDRWATLGASSNAPLELHDAIESQKARCDAVVASKDALIAELEEELKTKDDDYVKSLKQNEADVTELLRRMAEQFRTLQARSDSFAPVPVRPRPRGERRSLRTSLLPGARVSPPTTPRFQSRKEDAPRRLSTPSDAFELRMDRPSLDPRQTRCAAELERAEVVFLEQRAELLEKNKADMDSLFERRNILEQNFMEHSVATAFKYGDELEKCRAADAAEYNVLKIRLETDVQNLQQHLEAMRATYQLNTEKLEYNYRVLVERDHENQSTIGQQRGKIRKRRESLIKLKEKYAEFDKKYQAENAKLAADYRRVTEQFKELQVKCRHFEITDRRKYEQVWAMNEAQVAGKVRRALAADKTIHEQQLGMVWHAPSDDVFKSPEELALAAAKKKLEAAASAAAAERAARGEGEEEEEEEGEGATTTAGDEGDLAPEEEEEENPFEQRVRDPAYAGFLAALVDETSFLIDPKTSRVLKQSAEDAAASGDADQIALAEAAAARLKAETTLRALAVSDAAAFDGMVLALTRDGEDPIAAAATASGGVKDVMVDAELIIPKLRAFVESEKLAREGGTAGGTAGGVDASRALKAAEDAAADAAAAPRKTKEQLEREFWENMSDVVGPKTYAVWGQLEEQLTRYHAMLRSRREGLEAATALKAQNDELRSLLGQYLRADANDDLQLPPSKLM